MERREELFWRKVKIAGDNECWLWQNELDDNGYGHCTYKGWITTAHRVAFFLRNGPIPKGMVVMHKCHNRGCVNPNHLQLGTQAENMADMRRKGRGFTFPVICGEKNSAAKLTDAEVEEIRFMYRNTRLSQQKIACMYDIGQSQISRILRGESRAA